MLPAECPVSSELGLAGACQAHGDPSPVAPMLDNQSLPGWIYHDPEFFAAEKETVFRTAWQLVCHVSDLPQAGDYHTLDLLGEPLVTVRGEDGELRSFHNVCRHRAARLLDGARGHCGKRISCPYHRWTYALDGTLVGVPQRKDYPGLEMREHGLRLLEQEVFLGFVFVRLAPGLPAVREMMAPYREELEARRFEELVPQGRVTLRPRPVNWKNIADNYADALHINVAHPGLSRLFGRDYGLEAQPWVDKMWGTLSDGATASWSERLYRAVLPPAGHLPAALQQSWHYYKLWPNTAFDVYPDQVDFMQFIPVSPTETLIREIAYAHPDERREMRAARYLNWRINRQVNREDTALIERVQAGMGSSAYESGPLGESEVCLRSFARRMRALIPEARLPRPPAAGWHQQRKAAPEPLPGQGG
jgi:carnitine monooxygenase subunit